LHPLEKRRLITAHARSSRSETRLTAVVVSTQF